MDTGANWLWDAGVGWVVAEPHEAIMAGIADALTAAGYSADLQDHQVVCRHGDTTIQFVVLDGDLVVHDWQTCDCLGGDGTTTTTHSTTTTTTTTMPPGRHFTLSDPLCFDRLSAYLRGFDIHVHFGEEA